LIIVAVSVFGLVAELHARTSGVFRYLLGMPVAMLFGVTVGALNWKLEDALNNRTRDSSFRTQGAIFLGLLGLQSFWIIAALIGGFELGSLLAG
jgi:hypothetical protein